MKKRRVILAVAALLLFTGIAVFLLAGERGPVYAGKPLRSFFPRWTHSRSLQISFPAEVADAMGPEAIPWLLRTAERKNKWSQRLFLKLESRLPAWIHARLPRPVDPRWIRSQAWEGIEIVARKGAAAMPALVEAFRTSAHSTRVQIIGIWRIMGPAAESAVPLLIDTAEHDSTPDMRSWCVDALLVLAATSDEALDAFLKLAERDVDLESPPVLRGWCQRLVLLRQRARPALPILLKLRHHSDCEVQITAIFAAWQIDPASTELIEELLMRLEEWSSTGTSGVEGGRTPMGAASATRLFPRPGSPAAATSRVLKLLADNGEMWGLGRYDAQAVLRPLLKPGSRSRETALRIVSQCGARSADYLIEVMEALADESPFLRVTAVLAVSRMGTNAEPAIPLVVRALRDGFPLAQRHAVDLLAQFGPKAAVALPELTALVADEREFSGSSDLRASAARALAAIGRAAESAIPALEKASQSPYEAVREAARAALQSLQAQAKRRSN